MAELLKGYPLSKIIESDLIKRVESLRIVPKLAIIRVGSRVDDLSYEKSILRRCSNVGIDTDVIKLLDSITTEELIDVIKNLNSNEDIHGILIFRPLHDQIIEEDVINTLDPNKDVDCATQTNLYKIFVGDNSGFAPCTSEAVVSMLNYYDIPIEGSKITLIGRSMVVGKPLSMMLLKQNATIKICHTRTKNLKKETQDSDILIIAAGRAEIIDDKYILKNTVVIDVGINVNNEGKLVGDVDFSKVEPIVKAISPVPKGVGGVTTAILAEHVVRAAESKYNM